MAGGFLNSLQCTRHHRFYPALLAGLWLLSPLTLSQNLDLFLYDDFSLDPEAEGYEIIAPRPTVQSVISQRLAGNESAWLDNVSTRLHTKVAHPLTDALQFQIDAKADFSWLDDAESGFTGTVEQATFAYTNAHRATEVGWQTLRWGSVHGARVIDVASPTGSKLTTTLAGDKLPQVSLRARNQWNDQSLEVFFTPRPRLGPMEPAVATAAQDVVTKAWPEVGIRYGASLGRANLAGYVALLTPDMPAFRFAEPLAEPRLEPYGMVGLSATYPIGALELKTELAYKNNLIPMQAGPQPLRLGSERDRIDAAVGLDLNDISTGSWSAFIAFERWLDTTDLAEHQARQSRLGLAWHESYFDDQLHLSAVAYSSLAAPYLQSIGEAIYDLSQEWALSLQVSRVIAGEETDFATLDGQTNYLMAISYGF